MNKRNIQIILTAIIAFGSIFLIGIPTAVGYYSFEIPPILDWVPFSLLEPVAILLIGGLGGWYLRGWYEQPTVEQVESITGCIDTDGVVWIGNASLANGTVAEIEVPYESRCPKCRSGMDGEKVTLGGGRGNPRFNTSTRYLWVCPNDDCDHSVKRDSDARDQAKSLFKRHIEEIVQTEDKPYSLANLVENIEGEVTGQSIWEMYATYTDDTHVSTACFP